MKRVLIFGTLYVPHRFLLKKRRRCCILIMKKYIETEGYIVASATDKQKDSLKEYMKKIKDIKLRVPEEYLQPIKDHAKSKGMRMNNRII